METIIFQREKETDKSKWIFNDTDVAILKSLLIFPYLTAEQVCNLHYKPTSLKYVMMRLAWLANVENDEKLTAFLRRDKEKRHAKTWDPYLYTLAKEGMKHLKKLD